MMKRLRDRSLLHGEDRRDELEHAGGALRVTERALGRAHRDAPRSLAEGREQAAPLRGVVRLGAGPVRVHVVHVVGRERGVVEGGPRGTGHTSARRIRRRRVVRVARAARAGDEGEHLGAARLGERSRLEHDEPRALAEGRPARLTERRALAGGEEAERVKPRENKGCERVRAARENDVGEATEDQIAREADRVGGRRARGRDRDPNAARAERVAHELGETMDAFRVRREARSERQREALRAGRAIVDVG